MKELSKRKKKVIAKTLSFLFLCFMFCAAILFDRRAIAGIRVDNIKTRAKELYTQRLEKAYVYKTKALRVYMPIALEK